MPCKEAAGRSAFLHFCRAIPAGRVDPSGFHVDSYLYKNYKDNINNNSVDKTSNHILFSNLDTKFGRKKVMYQDVDKT